MAAGLTLATFEAPALSATRPVAMDVSAPVTGLDGKTVRLDTLMPKVCVVNFWASWCFPCRFEMPLLGRLHRRLGPRGVGVVAIAIDDAFESVTAYAGKYGFSFPVVYDADGVAKKAFSVESVPESYVLDPTRRAMPFTHPETGERSTLVSDPLIWDGEQIDRFLLSLL